jgi:hypothetical protein
MTKRQVLVIALITLLVAAVWTAVFLVMGRQKEDRKFVPPPFEENAEAGAPSETDDRYKMFDFAGVYSAGLIGEPEAKDGKAEICFASAETNTVWLKCKILSADDGTLLAETGVLTPGTFVRNVTLLKDLSGDVAVKYRVISYEPETYYSEGSVNISTTLHVLH